jgi:DNA-directed RNA polymerase III subunit RPC8
MAFDQVVSNLGLVITIYDILEIQGGFIYAGDGAAHYTVKFRVVVFRPFVGEVMVGRLAKCDRYAVQYAVLQESHTMSGITLACHHVSML